MNLKERVAIVTGGTRGIGRGICSRLAADGARVVVVGTKPETAAETAEALAKQFGVETASFGCDISDPAQVDSMVEAIATRFGQIDILVNNAGITRDNLILRMSVDDWDQVMHVNLRGMFNCTRRVTRHMLRRRSGAIVNLSSVVGLTGNAGQANYATSKAGILGFTKSIAKEFASKGIRANAVAPGYIETDMTGRLSETQKQELSRLIPLSRFGTAEDVARVVAFLVSDEAAYVTGQVIQVDGGMAM